MLYLTCSALYVVDLIKFRETAAGDNLRVIYETLSKDPNSLANLDQVCGHSHIKSCSITCPCSALSTSKFFILLFCPSRK